MLKEKDKKKHKLKREAVRTGAIYARRFKGSARIDLKLPAGLHFLCDSIFGVNYFKDTNE